MNRRVAVRAVVVRGGKLLCVRQKKYDGSLPMDNPYWNIPGGGLDDGEKLTDGVRREMLEETGVTPVVSELLYIQQFTYKEREFLEFFFHVTNAEDYLDIDLSKTSHGTIEIEEIAFVDPKTSNVLPKFLTTEPLEAHIAAKAPTKIFSYLG